MIKKYFLELVANVLKCNELEVKITIQIYLTIQVFLPAGSTLQHGDNGKQQSISKVDGSATRGEPPTTRRTFRTKCDKSFDRRPLNRIHTHHCNCWNKARRSAWYPQDCSRSFRRMDCFFLRYFFLASFFMNVYANDDTLCCADFDLQRLCQKCNVIESAIC